MSSKVTASCKWCGHILSPQHIGLCPACGREGKEIKAMIKDVIKITDSLSWIQRRTYYEHHKVAYVINLVIAIGSPFLGLVFGGWAGVIVGLVISGTSHVLGPMVTSKIIEITKGNS